MNRTDRLLAIILLLQSRKIVRAKDISANFEISLRTVYRDMKALGEAGVPIAAEAGEGYGLVAGYHLPPVMFSKEEASALFLGGEFLARMTDKSVVSNAESALLKIQAVLPDETKDYLKKALESTAMFAGPRNRSGGFRDDTLLSIQDAIVNQRVVRLEYYSFYRDSFTRREAEPLGLIYYANHWHLISYCRLREDYRDFRTDRIKAIVLLEESFQVSSNFTLKEYLKGFHEIENGQEVQVKFNRLVASSVRDKALYGLIAETELEDGLKMTFLVENFEYISRWLLSFGRFVEIISPPELREYLLAQARNLVKHYE